MKLSSHSFLHPQSQRLAISRLLRVPRARIGTTSAPLDAQTTSVLELPNAMRLTERKSRKRVLETWEPNRTL